MENLVVKNNNIYVNYASRTFLKSIPFKIYHLRDNKAVSSVHTHDYLQIWYVLSGNCVHHVGDNIHSLVNGDIFVIPPFIPHSITVDDDHIKVEILGCEFSTNLINENFSNLYINSSLFDFAYLEPFLVSINAVRPCLHLTGRYRDIVENLFLDMLHEYNDEPEYYQLSIKADVLKLLAMIARVYNAEISDEASKLFEKYRNSMSSAIDYIKKNFTKKLYIKDISSIALMSRTSFSYIFKQVTGKTFVEYINDLRIKKAVELLSDTALTVSEVCFLVGFNDTAYFNRVFRKEIGMSPKKYRSMSG